MLLAEKLHKRKNSLVLAIPRGGVVIGHEISKILQLPLFPLITKKISAPENPELAIGAVSATGSWFLDSEMVKRLDVSKEYLEKEINDKIHEAKRREKVYLPSRSLDFSNKEVIIVDDGIATGATIEAAIKSVKEGGAKKITVAVPVISRETAEELKDQIDELVALQIPKTFSAVGEFYKHFSQTSDEEVLRLLNPKKK